MFRLSFHFFFQLHIQPHGVKELALLVLHIFLPKLVDFLLCSQTFQPVAGDGLQLRLRLLYLAVQGVQFSAQCRLISGHLLLHPLHFLGLGRRKALQLLRHHLITRHQPIQRVGAAGSF